MKKRINNLFLKINPYLPYILLFIFYFIIHFSIGYIADDAINIKNTYPDGQIKYLIDSYNNWSSRLFIYFVNNIVYMLPIIVWKIIDTLIIVIGAKCISVLINDKKSILLDYIICILISIFPFTIMGTAGFIATTVTYYWPIVFLLICLIPIKKIMNNESIKKYMYPIYFILLLYSTDCEQITCFIIGLSICYILYMKFIKKEKIHWYVYSIFIISILKLLFIETCPGNAARTLVEINTRFPEYKNLTLLDKINMGLFYTSNNLIVNYMPILVLSILLCVMTNKNKNIFNKLYSDILLIVIIFSTILLGVLEKISPLAGTYISNLGTMIKEPNTSVSTITLLLIIYYSFSFIYLIFINFKKNLLPIILFLGGIATQFILIFSPTIYESGQRTGSIMFYSIIVISVIIFKKINMNKYMKIVLSSFFIFFSFITLYNFFTIY